MEKIGKPHVTEANGTSIAWTEMGTGAPLVLLHGLCDSHRTWRRAAPLLAERFRCLMPDLPGHGTSGRPDAPYTLGWYAGTLLAWMDAIGVRRAHLAGHSYGGGVAQWMVLEDRKRVDRLALVAPGGLGREVAIGLRLATFPLTGPLLAPLAIRLGTPMMMRIAPAMFGHIEPEEVDRLARMNAIPGSARAFRRTVAGVIDLSGQTVQTWQRIEEVASLPPIATFWGEEDPILPVRQGLAARDRLRGATLSTYPGCGHYVHLDDPGRFARELAEFLTDPRRRPARFVPAPRDSKPGETAGRNRPLDGETAPKEGPYLAWIGAMQGRGQACLAQ